MLKKLQNKFIWINMLLVGIVLLLVFAVLVISNYRQNVEAVQEAMTRTLQMRILDTPNPDFLPQIGKLPDYPLSFILYELLFLKN